jgi:hypothetical protein
MICKYCKEFDSECHICVREKRFQKIKNDEPQPFYIVAYGISRHYGGPEEGGWYFDWRQVLSIRKVWSIKQALVAIREFKEWYPQSKYNRSSVLGGEDTEIKCLASLDFVKETTKRPKYE